MKNIAQGVVFVVHVGVASNGLDKEAAPDCGPSPLPLKIFKLLVDSLYYHVLLCIFMKKLIQSKIDPKTYKWLVSAAKEEKRTVSAFVALILDRERESGK